MEQNIQKNIAEFKSKYLNDSMIDSAKLKWLNFRVGTERKSKMLEKIAARLESGDAIKETLKNLISAYESQQPKSNETKFLKILAERYTFKPKISYMLAPFFDSMIIGVAHAIENDKSAADVIKLCVGQLKRKQDMKRAGFLGVVGPIVGILLVIGICTGAHLYIFEALLKGLRVEPKGAMKFGISFTRTVYELSPYIISFLAGYMFWVFWSIPNQINRRLTAIPPWSVVDAINSAITLQTITALLKVGVSTSEALKLVGKSSTPYVRYWCYQMRMSMIGGKSEGEAIACDFFAKEPRIEIESYASTENFTDKLEMITEEVFKSTESLVTKLTTMIMLFVLAMVLSVNGIVAIALTTISSSIS
jgi:type II secretory pathway component PulF